MVKTLALLHLEDQERWEIPLEKQMTNDSCYLLHALQIFIALEAFPTLTNPIKVGIIHAS